MTSPDPSARPPRPETQWRGPSLRTVMIGVFALGGLMTWQMHRAYVHGEKVVQAAFPVMEEKGKSLDAEGCIDAVIAWHKECDATAVMCNHGVKQAMYHCLKSQDRQEGCKQLPSSESMDGKWVFLTCKERGSQCKRTKDCVCADAYRAFDSFCRTDGEAVQL
ncbi:hypothetical protein OV090_14550 [Nannocystis sp. RBIL2]|uniref:hypothetical protein n=1 Tax=Nannocystis sp. RBIL2 TaxID=2996788 RepID=UPI00226F86F3|nr:hypothetical protein [Nannocystis sp. RBIL2]MCY1065998.1 hypothetical protein [Nannocystis sp. RBIL2]